MSARLDAFAAGSLELLDGLEDGDPGHRLAAISRPRDGDHVRFDATGAAGDDGRARSLRRRTTRIPGGWLGTRRSRRRRWAGLPGARRPDDLELRRRPWRAERSSACARPWRTRLRLMAEEHRALSSSAFTCRLTRGDGAAVMR